MGKCGESMKSSSHASDAAEFQVYEVPKVVKVRETGFIFVVDWT